jgi:hypothetical protein
MSAHLTSIRSILLPGLYLASRSSDRLPDIPSSYPHIRAVLNAIPLLTVGDLTRLPHQIVAGDLLYETKLVFAGREYPQGWGRGPGGAAAEPEREPDGKVDTFRHEDNANMVALKAEIENLIEAYGWARP